jgi:hypothetical protein
MRLLFTVSGDSAVRGRPMLVTVTFENGGDTSVHLLRLEASTSRGEFRAIEGAALPAFVLPGGLKELYRYPVELPNVEPYSRQFAVVDRKGDSWKAGIELGPCQN